MKILYFSFATISLFLVSCGSPKKSTKTKSAAAESSSSFKPIEGLELPINTFTVSADKGSTIKLPNGGSIVVPANAFVDENGKPVKGKVDIAWQEYHSLADIALSGIPMDYDSAGVSSDLVSGGMFNINGSQKKKPVKIAPNKELEINLVTTNPEKHMNFYSLDEKSGKWKYKSTDVAKPAPEAQMTNLKKAKETSFTTLDVNAKIDKQEYPELNSEDILGWETNTTDLSKDEQKKIKAAICTAEITAKSGNKYTLRIKNKYIDKNIECRPVTFDNPPSKSDVNNVLNKRIDDMENLEVLARSGQLYRSISIPNFGIFNWDKMYMEPTIDANVTIDIPNTKDENLATFFFVSPDSKRAVQISSKDKIRLASLIPAFIIGITKRKEVFTIRNKTLNKIRESNGNGDYSFVMERIPGRMNRPEDMERFMNRCN